VPRSRRARERPLIWVGQRVFSSEPYPTGIGIQDEDQEAAKRGKPWWNLAKLSQWLDVSGKRSGYVEGMLVVNEDFTKDAARRVGRLLSAEIDQAMFILLPAAFYSYLMIVMLRVFYLEQSDFWQRWISEDSANTTTTLEFRNERSHEEVCIRRFHTPSFYQETKCPGFVAPKSEISIFIIFIIIISVFALFFSVFWLKMVFVFIARGIKSLHLWARNTYLNRRQASSTRKQLRDERTSLGYLSDDDDDDHDR